MPQDAAYRKYTEQLIKDRLKHVEMVRTPAGRAPEVTGLLLGS